MSRVPRAHFNFYRPEVVDMSYQKIQKMIEDNPGLAPAPVLAGEEPVVKRVVAGLNSAGLKFEPGLEKVDSLVSAIVGKMGDMSNSTVNVASAQVSSIVSKWYNGHKKSLRTTAGAIAAGAIVLFAVCIVVGMAVKFEMTPEQIQQLWGRTGQSLATNASKLWDIIKDTFTGIEFETVFKFVPEASPVPAPGVRGPGVAAAKAATPYLKLLKFQGIMGIIKLASKYKLYIALGPGMISLQVLISTAMEKLATLFYEPTFEESDIRYLQDTISTPSELQASLNEIDSYAQDAWNTYLDEYGSPEE